MIKIKEFKMTNLLPDATVLILGRRRSGKSWLVRDIMYHHKNIPSGVVFSGTESVSPFFSGFIPDVFIHSEYKPEVMKEMMDKQAMRIRKCKEQGLSDDGKLPSNNRFIILDDLQDNASMWNKERTIRTLFYNGRHYNYLFLLTLQYIIGIDPGLRSNLDYVFVFAEPNIKNKRKIYENYAGMVDDFDTFRAIMDSCTGDNKCLVIRTNGTSMEDSLFMYKAKAHNDFRVGHRDIWKFHDKKYNEKYETNAVQKDTQSGSDLKRIKVVISRDGRVIGHEQVI